MSTLKRWIGLCAVIGLSGCATTGLVSSWKAPEISSRPGAYAGPMFWGGGYGQGWGGNEIRTDTIVIVETLVYSLARNQLVWGGQSKTRNPASVDRLIENTAGQVADELVRQGLIAKSGP